MKTEFSGMTRAELERRLAEAEGDKPRKINTEIFNDPRQMRFEAHLAGGRKVVLKRLTVAQMDAIQTAVAEAYRDNASRMTIEAVKEQYLASLQQVGTKVLSSQVTAEELWNDLGRNRSQYTQLWHVAHDTTEEEDHDFFGSIRAVTAHGDGAG
jgi:hypothetical protein